jgi:hypothetical protein
VLFLIALTLGFLLALHGGPLGIVQALPLLIWLFDYSYVLLEQIADGGCSIRSTSTARCCNW